MLVKYKNETSSASAKEKTHCFFIILVWCMKALVLLENKNECRICIANEHLMH